MTARPTPAARRPRTTPARTGDDTGMTLSELVVVMMIGSVVLALVAALTIGLTQGNAHNLARQGQVDQALSAMRWLSRSLGQAVAPGTLSQAMAGEAAVLEASGTELVFYSNIDNPSSDTGEATGPTRVTVRLGDDGVLRRITQRPDPTSTTTVWSYDCPPTACPELHEDLVIARDVQAPVFRYVARGGAALPADGDDRALTPAEAAAIDAVEVTVVVASGDPSAPAGPTTVLRRISLDTWSRL